jgi:hypothetical protein
MLNCTFVGNQSSSGGGISIWDSQAKATIANCTFLANQAEKGGALYIHADNQVEIVNSILWGNTATTENEIYGSGANTRVVYGIIQGGFASGIQIGQNDPQCLPLASNGGPVQTCALGSGSPAIDAGVYAFLDQENIVTFFGEVIYSTCYYSQNGAAPYYDCQGNPYSPKNDIRIIGDKDARGVVRPKGSLIDIGAFEKE